LSHATEFQLQTTVAKPKISSSVILKDSKYILGIFDFKVAESHKKVLLIKKYVTLYSYVNMCSKCLSKIMSFSSPLRVIYEFFQVVKAL
jgi:hypothetical protein